MSGRQVRHNGRLPLAHVIKIGGSTFDTGRYEQEHNVLPDLAATVVSLFTQGQKMIITCGAGPNADGLKSDRDAYGLSLETYSQGAADAVKINCALFAELLRKAADDYKQSHPGYTDGINVEFSETTRPLLTNGSILEQISVVSFADDTLMRLTVDDVFDRAESDVHTLLIAEGIGRYMIRHEYARGVRVHFVKNTDGVYLHDPNRNDITQSGNKRLPLVEIEYFLESIDRRSFDPTPDGGRKLTGDHLLEERAAELLRDELQVTKGLRIIKHTPADNLSNSIIYGKGGSLIVNRRNGRHQNPDYKPPASETTMYKRAK